MAVTPVSLPKATAAAVKTQLEYGVRPTRGSRLFYHLGEIPEGRSLTNVVFERNDVVITDLRRASRPMTLQENGFQLEPLPKPSRVDWEDEAEIKTVFYPEVEAVVKRATGANKVMIFDHTLRRGSVTSEIAKSGSNLSTASGKRPGPAVRAHVDYTANSGQNRLKQLIPEEEAAALQQSPYAILQVWRPLRGPVQDSPLAFCDVHSTCHEEDFHSVELRFPNRTGETYLVSYNDAHRWYYASGMQTDEMYLWKGYDSRPGNPCFVPHASFHDPNTPADAPERESIELRAYVFWENSK